MTPCPFAIHPALSAHRQGVSVLMADGSVRFTNENIDRDVWWSLGTTNSGDIVEQ
ncbi:MAG: DUF1559 domain-containing protein [Planctomycetaceae bacterium]|nr:DUF1559 domain-containing protein [Planctomycetaceae bacterium]